MKKKCFVIMGYGEKTDFFTGRILNLDKTYDEIIKPLVLDSNMECVRCDEIKHSGVIDKVMYEELISADMVIADLSTYNANVFYELGIRHALKPYTTIIISEEQLEYPFDIEHVVVHKYEHLGKDIGYSEVVRFRKEMKESIESILNNPSIDSPVYTYLPNLAPPELKQNIINKSLKEDENEVTLKSIITSANKALEEDRFIEAKALYEVALRIDKNRDYLIQKVVLCTYKSKIPSKKEALLNALKILEKLKPQITNDVETLGLASAIYKRLWEEDKNNSYLDLAIEYSERGFYISNSYYNGINLAFLLNLRGSISEGDDLISDYVQAKRIRKKVINICNNLIDNNFESRSDAYWILATMEEAYFGIGDNSKYIEYSKEAEKKSSRSWERNSTVSQINKLKILLEKYKVE